jgi:hypothetical protein
MKKILFISTILIIFLSCGSCFTTNYKESSEYALYKEFVYELDLDKKKLILEKITDDIILCQIIITNAKYKLYPKFINDLAALKIKDPENSFQLLKELGKRGADGNDAYNYGIPLIAKIEDDEILKKIYMYDFTKIKPKTYSSELHPLLMNYFVEDYKERLKGYDNRIKSYCLEKIKSEEIIAECLKNNTYKFKKESISKEFPELKINYDIHPGNLFYFKQGWEIMTNDDSFDLDLLDIDLGSPLSFKDYNEVIDYAKSLRNDSTIKDIKEFKFDSLQNDEFEIKKEKIGILKNIVNKRDIFIRSTGHTMEGDEINTYLITYNQKSYKLTDTTQDSYGSLYIALCPIEILNISTFDSKESIYKKGNFKKITDFNDSLKNAIVIKYYDPNEKKISWFW